MPSFNPSDFPQVAGKCFLVTGASSGIGRETALLLAELGATVILNGRNEARLEETRTRMKGEGHLVAPGRFMRDVVPSLVERIVEYNEKIPCRCGALRGHPCFFSFAGVPSRSS